MSVFPLPRALKGALGLLVFGLSLLAFSPLSLAQEGESAPVKAALTPQGQFIQKLGDKALAILSDKTTSAQDKNNQFHKMLLNAFDLNVIGRYVIGRVGWAVASEEQRTEYQSLFEKLVVQMYLDRFALYTDEGFQVTGTTPESDRDTLVNSQITHPDGSPPASVAWRVRTTGKKMHVLDVIIEGVSMSLTQNREYTAVLQRNGGDVEALLDMMRQRVAGKSSSDS
ncbi:MAG: ABC transporter substrate-binding protein [Alphaproteobacteria bacterium]|nr:ABC transporter substrate-binding protein [Alphaproteobacteria bacterium]